VNPIQREGLKGITKIQDAINPAVAVLGIAPQVAPLFTTVAVLTTTDAIRTAMAVIIKGVNQSETQLGSLDVVSLLEHSSEMAASLEEAVGNIKNLRGSPRRFYIYHYAQGYCIRFGGLVCKHVFLFDFKRNTTK
jgi:hypothetical protein